MKKGYLSYLVLFFSYLIGIVLLNSCDMVTIDRTSPPLVTHLKDKKPDTPIPLGCIRAYFGDYYMTFSQQIETVQPVDSFSNVFVYGDCNFNQIIMTRRDSSFVVSIYLTGYSLESLPVNMPLPEEYGKYPAIDFYPADQWKWNDPVFYSLAYYIQKCIFIVTDKTDDILTGTFSGMLQSSSGDLLPMSDGEFKIKILRKKISCVQAK
jgi:hypothetical protein